MDLFHAHRDFMVIKINKPSEEISIAPAAQSKTNDTITGKMMLQANSQTLLLLFRINNDTRRQQKPALRCLGQKHHKENQGEPTQQKNNLNLP